MGFYTQVQSDRRTEPPFEEECTLEIIGEEDCVWVFFFFSFPFPTPLLGLISGEVLARAKLSSALNWVY